MKITFLGTSAGSPTLFRHVSATALQLTGRSDVFLFDCGEGTQYQFMKSALRLSQVNRIFITHLHGDHLFGLPGLLGSRSQNGIRSAVTIYGPEGLREFTECAFRTSGMYLTYPLEFVTVRPGVIHEQQNFFISCVAVDHRVEAYGYAVTENERPGHLNVEKALELGVPSGPLWGRLKKGETVRLEDGSVIDGASLLGPQQRGQKMVISGDTAFSPALAELSKDADVLVHEATFMERDREMAQEWGHSTSVDAARTAKAANAKMLILTHFSARYEAKTFSMLPDLLEEAKTVFPNTFLANDLDVFEIAGE